MTQRGVQQSVGQHALLGDISLMGNPASRREWPSWNWECSATQCAVRDRRQWRPAPAGTGPRTAGTASPPRPFRRARHRGPRRGRAGWPEPPAARGRWTDAKTRYAKAHETSQILLSRTPKTAQRTTRKDSDFDSLVHVQLIPTSKFLRRYDDKGPRERTTSPRRCGSGTPHPAVSRKIQCFPAVFVMDNSHLFPQRRRVSDCLGWRCFGCLSQRLGCLCFADHVHNGRSVGDGHGLRDSVRAVLRMTTAERGSG